MARQAPRLAVARPGKSVPRSERAPGLTEIIDATLRRKLPLKIDWGGLHRRAVAATVAEHLLMIHEVSAKPRRDDAMPADDLVASIDRVLRRKLPQRVKWTDKLESEIVAYAVAEQIMIFFELRPRTSSARVVASSEKPRETSR